MNRLARETSPYLRQHADNPVDWYPWGDEAFAAASRRDVPILLSVGYSSCHWCHVMAHESFEDADVAALMNELFVNVKVDREERPDVDAVYMDAVQALTQRGGWPMTVFLTPTGEPFFGGTYFPKPTFLSLLRGVDDVWRNRRSEIDDNVEGLMEALQRTARIEPASQPLGVDEINQALTVLLRAFDSRWGGFGGAPKFPSTMSLELLLRAHVASGNEECATAVVTTLDAMAAGGIYDHLGGGFARYSTDERWLVPHFEKMLYDQALLVRAYTRAWQVFGHDSWRQVVEETIGYVLRELRDAAGGLYSAEDADSAGADGRQHEGLFYVWTPDEIRDSLGDEVAGMVCAWYGVTPAGNFAEGTTRASILNRMHATGQLARPPAIDEARQRLFEARAARPRPGLDDKVLAEWNGLFVSALAEAAAAFCRPDWLAAATTAGEFLLRELRGADGRWHRSWQAAGGARHDALAADLAALVDAFTRLAEATGQSRWIDAARAVADDLLGRFWDADNGGLFTTSHDGERLVARQKDVYDDATPSANSTAAVALLRLGALTGDERYTARATQIVQLVGSLVASAPTGFSNLLAAVDMLRVGITEIAVVGDRPDLVTSVQRRYLPDAVLAWGEPYPSPLWDGRTDGFAYVCRDYTCLAPAADVAALTQRLESS